MGDSNKRGPIVAAGAFTAVTIGLAFLLTRGGPRISPDVAASASSPSLAARGAIAVPTATAPGASAVASVVASAASVAPHRPTEAELWPEPLPNPAIRVSKDPSEGDPFESKLGRPGDVRELTHVGAVRLGVTNDSKVRDERAVIAVLGDLGAEIDAAEKGRTDSYEARVMDYQKIFDRYRPRLAPLMDGSFATKSGDWTDTERIVRPGAPAASAKASP